MKQSMYFETEEEKNEYFPNGVPSNVIAIVGENSAIYTSSNNYLAEGVPTEQGGIIGTSPEDEARITALEENKADKSELAYYTTYSYIEGCGFATEAYVTNAIAAIPAVDLTGYATETYVSNAVAAVVGTAPETLDTLQELAYALNDDANFASYVASELANKANASDIPDLTGYATETYVTNAIAAIPAVDLTGYATETYVTNAIAAIPAVDLTGYATETYVTNAIAAIPTVDLTGYATETYVVDYVAAYGGGTQVQADWSVTDSSSDAFIKNKPELRYTSDYAFEFGVSSFNNKAPGRSAIACGEQTYAKGYRSFACGNYTSAMGNNSFITGTNNQSFKNDSVTLGFFNYGYSYSLFSIGNGTANNARRNAFEILDNGDLYAYGIGNYSGNNATDANSHTLAYVINDIDIRLGSAETITSNILGE